MHLLLIGGTRFLGRHLVDQALAAGHRLTLFHRGRTLRPADLPGVRHLIGDRDDAADRVRLREALAADPPDAVIDPSCYHPRQADALIDLLGPAQGAPVPSALPVLVLVSTVSVYEDAAPGTVRDESAPRRALADPDGATLSGATYGALKRHAEDRVITRWPASRTLIVRPGLLVGPGDPTGRFSWWIARLGRGGTVPAPARPDAPVQWLDARDAAAFVLQALAQGRHGLYNLAGPAGHPAAGPGTAVPPGEPRTLPALLETLRRALAGLPDSRAGDARFAWVSDAALEAAGVAPFTGLPLWLPEAAEALHRMDVRAAEATGWRTRPVAETARDLWEGVRVHGGAPVPAPDDGLARPAVGLSDAQEAALLAAPDTLLPAPLHPCPRCGGPVRCGMSDPTPCACTTVTLTRERREALRARWPAQGCLCVACLQALSGGDAPSPRPS
jgi:2'-hydroxyisoflavone reductase